jgi:hypothetical protein
MEEYWLAHETNTHQDHVIAHVLGATVLGYFVNDETAYLLLDIGFIWIIHLDGEMGLVPQAVAIDEMDLDPETKTLLRADIERLHQMKLDPASPFSFVSAPAECVITEVGFEARASERRVLVVGEEGSLTLETSLLGRQFRIYSS